MSWDLYLILILVALSGSALLVGPLVHWINRVIGWYRVRQFSQAYLPHAASDKPWKQNEWKQKERAL